MIDPGTMARKALRWIVATAFPLLDAVVPKNHRLVMFSRWLYADNSRAVFEALARSNHGLEPVWLATSPRQLREVAATTGGGNVVAKMSIAGLWTALRARTVVLSHDVAELEPYSVASGRKTVVMLWHAISFKGPKPTAGVPEHSERRYRRKSARYAAMIASSEVDRLAKAAVHQLPLSRVFVTGLPRTDELLRPARLTHGFPPEIARALDATTILYAPTYREAGKVTEFFPFADFDAQTLNSYLCRIDAYILFRPHKNDRTNLERAAEWKRTGLDRLVLATIDQIADVADVLSHVDMLVTDFSSIYLDFLVVDRPIIFLPYDLADYWSSRGMLYDYDTVAPGPRPATQEAFIAAIDAGLKGAPEFAAHRAMLKRLFHAFDDGRATERVVDVIRSLDGRNRQAARPDPNTPSSGSDTRP